jgi:NAD(P)-dependent dehydrogenase (short-subunit alcohol dehydrogenase family)
LYNALLTLERCSGITRVRSSAAQGRAIADTLSAAGAQVVVVGRSAAPPGVAADLSTVGGCLALVAELRACGFQFGLVVLTVGVWPDVSEPRTDDGVDKVVALDLLARHVLCASRRHATNLQL